MESILSLIPTVMGLGLIDENMTSILEAMESLHADLGLSVIRAYAQTVGLCLALGVGANECYQMMLGRRGMDVMKIVYIVIISMCITSADTIASMARWPGKYMEGIAKDQMNAANNTVIQKEKEVAQLQQDYLDKVREKMEELEQANIAASQEDGNKAWYDKIFDIDSKLEHMGNIIKESALVLETKICEWFSLIIRLLGEIILQACYYGLLICQRIFLNILAAFAPLMFALSLSPHFKSAWSQWLSKYISLSLWGFVVYTCMYYVFTILTYNLKQDIAAYSTLMGSVEGGNYQIAAMGMQALGSTCMYIIGILIGVRVLAFVPEVASWLIPGGVSSGAGSSAVGTATSGASTAATGAITTAGWVGTGSAAVAAGASKVGESMRNRNWDAARNGATS